MNTVKPKRNISEVIDQMIAALGDKKPSAIESLKNTKAESGWRAPELEHLTWRQVQEILHDEILADTPPEEFSDEQKAVIRIFTDNPNIV